MVRPESPIHALIAQLPEVYQPIVGYPQYDERASRGQDRRLDEVLQLHDQMVQVLGRPLRVLDLGCAQGYFSLQLAARGAQVLGIDYLDLNVAVCLQLARENPGLSVKFEVGRIEDVIGELQQDEYDLVLGLSVFHHLIYLHGAESVKALLERVAGTGASLLTEMALASEPLYWAESQPDDPATLLDGIAFVSLIGRYPTHLSDIQRPLYFASDRLWYLGGNVQPFSQWQRASHDMSQNAHRGTRTYYFSDALMAKKFSVEGELAEVNRQELRRELDVLSRNLPHIRLPRVTGSGESFGEAWLVREKIPGRLLSDVLQELDTATRRKILEQLLSQLASLEASGLFHGDVRVWNVLLDEAGAAHIIDYGSISAEPSDCLWPYDIHLSFLIFAQELVGGEILLSDPIRRAALSPASLVPELRGWAASLFQRPLRDWTFPWMAEELTARWGKDVDAVSGGIDPALWLSLLEQSSQIQLNHAKHVHSQLDVIRFETDRRFKEERALAWSDKEQVKREMEVQVRQLRDQVQEVQRNGEVLAGLESRLNQFAEREANARSGLLVELRRMNEESVTRLADLAVQVGDALRQAGSRADGVDSQLLALREEVVTHSAHGHAIAVLQQEIALIKGSRSWRLTAPLRSANRNVAALTLQVKILLRPLVVRVARKAMGNPAVRRWARPLVLRNPRVAGRLQRFLQGAGLIVMPIPVARTAVPAHGLSSQRARNLAARAGARIEQTTREGA